ncbi:unnamed protein product [Rotaria sp. Silwood1]|nr:unnamed protein product [Rotaria sp. Silwood1]CAF0930106.1 unnamed protein product [Rotaria sp. Silwood1]CAF3454657.1 unnamed protein product [Rotaria sp. Silwood1]CAF5009711.1 unnamed protein product [Rotaria sp. Silwood1]
MSFSPNIGSFDLESVLNVGRRRLSSISETSLPYQQYRYTDTIYLKRESDSNSLFSITSKILIFGELQFLCNIFERYKSTITVYENSSESDLNKTYSLVTSQGNENINKNDANASNIISTNNEISTSPQSSSTLKVIRGPMRRKSISTFGRSQRASSITGDYSGQRLEGKHYGCVELPDMNLIEILEILLRTGLELVHESNGYDGKNVLHQDFIFSKPLAISQKFGQSFYSR